MMQGFLQGLLGGSGQQGAKGGGLLGGFGEFAQGLPNDPLINIAAGLLSAAGPSAQPQSVGDGLVRGLQLAGGAQTRQLQNDAVRQRLTAENQQAKQQARFREQLPGLLGGFNLDEQQTQALGLLAQQPGGAAAITQSLVGQAFPAADRAPPAIVRIMQEAGIDPAGPEGQEILRRHLSTLATGANRGGGGVDGLIDLMRLDLARQQFDRQQGEATDLQLERQGDFTRQMTSLLNMSSLIEPLSDGVFALGNPFGDAVETAGGMANFISVLAGRGELGNATQLTQRQSFDKLVNEFNVSNAEGRTNFQIETGARGFANTGIRAEANALIITSAMKDLLRQGNADPNVNVSPELESEINSRISILEGLTDESPPPSPLRLPSPRIGGTANTPGRINFNDLPE